MLGGRYRLERVLACGASAAVYRAREVSSGRAVAIKLIAAELAAGFVHTESAALCASRSLCHPNIARVFDAGRSREAPYVVMELAEGNDVRAYTRPGRLLPLATVLSIGARIADALAHAHARGLVHGDLSPANIVFERASGAVKLVDFERPRGSRPTPAYASPEQLCGAPATPASDQFSLGVVLYRLACGYLPFGAGSRPQLAHAIVHEPHVDIRARDPSLPAGISALFDRACAKPPRGRFASAGDFARAIRELGASLRPACAA